MRADYEAVLRSCITELNAEAELLETAGHYLVLKSGNQACWMPLLRTRCLRNEALAPRFSVPARKLQYFDEFALISNNILVILAHLQKVDVLQR